MRNKNESSRVRGTNIFFVDNKKVFNRLRSYLGVFLDGFAPPSGTFNEIISFLLLRGFYSKYT